MKGMERKAKKEMSFEGKGRSCCEGAGPDWAFRFIPRWTAKRLTHWALFACRRANKGRSKRPPTSLQPDFQSNGGLLGKRIGAGLFRPLATPPRTPHTAATRDYLSSAVSGTLCATTTARIKIKKRSSTQLDLEKYAKKKREKEERKKKNSPGQQPSLEHLENRTELSIAFPPVGEPGPVSASRTPKCTLGCAISVMDREWKNLITLGGTRSSCPALSRAGDEHGTAVRPRIVTRKPRLPTVAFSSLYGLCVVAGFVR